MQTNLGADNLCTKSANILLSRSPKLTVITVAWIRKQLTCILLLFNVE